MSFIASSFVKLTCPDTRTGYLDVNGSCVPSSSSTRLICRVAGGGGGGSAMVVVGRWVV